MVGAVAFLSPSPVNDGGQIGEVSVEVDVLSVVSADLRSHISLTLLESDTRQVQQLLFQSTSAKVLSTETSRTDLLPVVVVTAVGAVLGSGNGHLVAIRVHGGQDVDAGGVDEGLDALVSLQVLRAQELSQVDEQLAAQDFVSVHVGDVLDLRLHCRGSEVP